MGKIRFIFVLGLMVYGTFPSDAATPKPNGFELKRGVNISHWLSQSSVRGEQRAQYFTRRDVEFIASLGFDH
ncbi:MAG: hypothetical protein LBR06_01325, partial [Bacteroidales bacterium]|nr:hypothetical protein [Bacteroidales bacterium]